jgi:DNA-binding LytR/AlgR family response regulator
MISCIAIDDEPLALKLFETYAARIEFLQVAGTFTNLEEARACLDSQDVLLVFLDIQMPDMNGLDFFRQQKDDLLVVFTTAFSEYAIEGFEVNAQDYLLKPYNFERFEQACLKVKDYLEYKNKQKDKSLPFVMVKQGYGWEKIMFDEILYIESRDDYVKILLKNNKHILTKSTTKSMMEKLPGDDFVRVHRSYIVHRKMIKSIHARKIILSNDKEIPVGSNYKGLMNDSNEN